MTLTLMMAFLLSSPFLRLSVAFVVRLDLRTRASSTFGAVEPVVAAGNCVAPESAIAGSVPRIRTGWRLLQGSMLPTLPSGP